MQFTLPTGATISTVHWMIAGPTNVSGDVTTGNTSIEFVVGGLLAGAYSGAGQGITLTATDSQGDSCSSPEAPFMIEAGVTTQLFVQLTCFQNDGGPLPVPNTGSLEVEAGANLVAVPICPIITSFSVSPAEEPVGSTSTVQVLTMPPGSAVTYTSSNNAIASVVANSDASPAGSSATVLCTSAGQITLTASTTVFRPDGTTCTPNTMSALINCEPSDASIMCLVAGQTVCPGAGCTNLQTDNNNCGSCGTVCTGGAVCTNGTCMACSGVQAGCDAALASISVTAGDGGIFHPAHASCSATELALYEKQPTSGDAGAVGSCMRCAFSNGLLDLDGGGFVNQECEDLGNIGDGGTTAGISQCLATLTCDLGLTANGTDSCGGQLYSDGASPMGTVLTNAFCGASVAASTCTSGGATGACQTQWRNGFEGLSDPSILGGDTVTTYPSGMANNLATQLLTNCASSCFP
jgi:hypothetical protein